MPTNSTHRPIKLIIVAHNCHKTLFRGKKIVDSGFVKLCDESIIANEWQTVHTCVTIICPSTELASNSRVTIDFFLILNVLKSRLSTWVDDCQNKSETLAKKGGSFFL